MSPCGARHPGNVKAEIQDGDLVGETVDDIKARRAVSLVRGYTLRPRGQQPKAPAGGMTWPCSDGAQEEGPTHFWECQALKDCRDQADPQLARQRRTSIALISILIKKYIEV